MMRSLCAVLLTTGASLAYGYQPITSTYVGTNMQIEVTGQSGYQTQGGGGEFVGTITKNSAPTSQISTYFWCVDDQEAFYWNESRVGNVTLLSNVANNSQVRFDSITNSSTPHWTNTGTVTGFSSTLATQNTAADRYKLAAYLVTQYPGWDQQINGSTTALQNKADAIQKAIWSVTNNTTTGSSIFESGYNNLSGTTGNLSEDSVAYWVDQAIQHDSNIVTSQWAVVSWGAQANGTLNNNSYAANDSANQTFLVELDGSKTTNNNPTPEPGFYGALSLGLSGLFFVARRKKRG